MTAYYNEIDSYAARWLRNLIAAGHIAPGLVDERSIEDLDPDELARFAQCHFFAGIGVWSYALRLAGWPDDRPVWTGSCPCQPFSLAGKGKGVQDERHLWPAWHRLIRQRRPVAVFGEQVGGPAGIDWLAAVHLDLQDDAYAFAAACLPACSVGAPHDRERVFFVAHSGKGRREELGASRLHADGEPGDDAPRCGPDGGVAYSDLPGTARQRCDGGTRSPAAWVSRGPADSGLVGNAGGAGLPLRECDELRGARRREEGRAVKQSGGSFWADADWLPCRDGKARPVEPGTFPLAHGTPARVGRLRAYGNAIVAPLAAEFIRAADDCLR